MNRPAIQTALSCVCVLALTVNAGALTYHYGMNAHDVSGRTADKMTELGADIVRVVYAWDVIEASCKGCFDWSQTDAWRDELR